MGGFMADLDAEGTERAEGEGVVVIWRWKDMKEGWATKTRIGEAGRKLAVGQKPVAQYDDGKRRYWLYAFGDSVEKNRRGTG